MKKSLVLSLYTSSILMAAVSFTNPLPNTVKSTDNGGTLAAIDAYKDGIGAEIVNKAGETTDNSAMNTLVYKYGEAAKASGSTIVDEVMYGSGSANTKDNVLVGNLTVNGAACNDQNIATQGETWLNGVCQGGVSTNGTACNDGDIQTINDIYTNGVCAGTNVEGQSCTDDNFLTIQDKYIDGVCVGTLTANGQSCNDDNIMTVNDIYTDGLCAGTLTVNGQSCNDGHVMTVNDIYTNGICAGTLTVNGQTCTHTDPKVINEVYTDGVCSGTLTVNGATCTHTDPKVINEVYTDGVCAGTLTVNGATCTHTDPKVINEVYTDGVCSGTLTVNGATCIHSDPKVINETYTDGVCSGTLTTNGQTCNDGNALTIGETYLNGVCQGGTTAVSCKSIHIASPSLPTGVYSIDPDGSGAGAAINVYCDMTTDGGGWTLVRKSHGSITVSGSTTSNNVISMENLTAASASFSDTIWNQINPSEVINICNGRQTIYARNMSVPWSSAIGVYQSCTYNTNSWTSSKPSFSSSAVNSFLYQSCGGGHSSGYWGVLSGIYIATDTVDKGCYDSSKNAVTTGVAPSAYSANSGTNGWGGHGYVLIR